jgi:hypothetical protein
MTLIGPVLVAITPLLRNMNAIVDYTCPATPRPPVALDVLV